MICECADNTPLQMTPTKRGTTDKAFMSGPGIKKKGDIKEEKTRVGERTEARNHPVKRDPKTGKVKRKAYPRGATKAYHSKLPGLCYL
jgi:hypothetical protein